jgi:hypothetical protein
MSTPHHHREGEPCRDVEDRRLIDPRVQVLLSREAAQLAARFDGTFSTGTVTAVVHDSFDQLAARASIHTHLPVLAAVRPPAPGRHRKERRSDHVRSARGAVRVRA